MKTAAAFAVALCALSPLAARGDQLTVDEIVALHPVSGTPPSGFVWSPDGTRLVYTLPGATEKAPPVVRVHDLRSGADRPLFAAKAEQRGSRSRAIGEIVWSPDGTRIAFVNGDALEVANADGGAERRIAQAADDPQWSPDGTRLAYVRGGDLYAAATARGATVRLTRDGSATVSNGDPDWLYSEELGLEHGYRWSPRGDAIAFLRFDDGPVTPFPIQRFLERPVNGVEQQRYPLAGARNPHVALRIADLRGRVRTLADNAVSDAYLTAFAWTPDGSAVVDQVIDRPQRDLRLVAYPRNGAAPRTVFRETDPRFVEVHDAPRFIAGGRALLCLSWRDGAQALERVDLRTRAVRRLGGDLVVASVERIDEGADAVYVTALAPTRRDRALMRIPLDGRGAALNLTPEPGVHAALVPPHGALFLDRYGSRTTPPRITIRDLHGTVRTTLFATPPLGRFALGEPRYVPLPSRWGTLDAWVLTPPAFDAAKRYPAVVEIYGGPLPVSWRNDTDDRWPGLFDQLLAQHGFVVMHVDGPASRADRAANTRMFSGAMGTIAIEGPRAAAAWLRAQPYVDGTRLGLSGWSYGGYLAAYTMTHAPLLYASAIAGAPPTDWRWYDSAYTERYLGTPQKDGAAYDRASALAAASNLRGRLLLLHGTSDDNVHLMNSIAFVDAAVKAGKPVDLFLFPGARHGPTGIAARRYLDEKELAWWEATLAPR